MNGALTRCLGLHCLLMLFAIHVNAHTPTQDEHGNVTYLGNEGIFVNTAGQKLLFDPFFHNTFGIYQGVPEDIRQSMLEGSPPYDNVNALFISHAHQDHFSAVDVLNFLENQPGCYLVAPKQAISQIQSLSPDNKVQNRLISIDLDFRQEPVKQTVGKLAFDAVRIPHAGWPGRADVENIVFRVTFPDGVVIMHMGDADPDIEHYLPFREHWNKYHTDNAFPPYWFFHSLEGRDILSSYLNVRHSIGVHVPVDVPAFLLKENHPHFSRPGEMRKLGQHDKSH